MGKIFGILVSVGLIIAGLSGEFVLRGTGSSAALVVAGVIFLIFDIIGLAKGNESTEEVVQTSAWSLPDTPVYVDPDSGFMFEGMLSKVESSFPNNDASMINVKYKGVTVLQILNEVGDGGSGKHTVALYFFPGFSKEVVERFRNCYYIDEFEILEDSETFSAFYEEDYEKAVKVASYVLATVYYIPTHFRLDYVLDKF